MLIRLTAHRGAALALIIALAACGRPAPVPSQQPVTSTPAPRPAPPPPARAANWIDNPATAGTWRHRMAGRDSIADFVGQDGTRLFQLACTQDRSVKLARIGAAGDGRLMTVRTRTGDRNLTAERSDVAVAATLTARDPLLGAMAYSRGRFAVEVSGMNTLYLPSWPEVTRVIDDCQ